MICDEAGQNDKKFVRLSLVCFPHGEVRQAMKRL